MTEGSPVPHKCAATGLQVVPTQAEEIYRIAKLSFGPLNPPLREVSSDVGDWGRWDVPRGRTIYAADTEEIVYRELLAYLVPSEGLQETKLSGVFEDSAADGDDRTLLAAISGEWDTLCSFRPHKVTRSWRDERELYRLTAPPSGWMVDIEHQDSIDALNRALAYQLAAAGISRLTRSHLLGENRWLTVMAAEWVHSVVLDDGNLAHGIKFSSKHGSNLTCWAIWLRKVDDGQELSTEPTKHATTSPILAPDQNPALRAAADGFGLTVY